MIDTNIHLSRWPTRRLPHDSTAPLVDKLRRAGIEQAWAGSFDGLLHKDIGAVNGRLAQECAGHADLLIPFGSVNPTLPDWQDDLRRCREEYHMPGIRLHPNYHGYKLEDPRFAELLDLAERHGLIVQLALKMEDERTQHPLLRVEPVVDTRPLSQLLPGRDRLRLVLLNSLRDLRADALGQLAQAGHAYFEISMLEGVAGIEKLLQAVPLDRVLLGSHFPFFYLESALLKVHESELAQFQIAAITHDNARRLLATDGAASTR